MLEKTPLDDLSEGQILARAQVCADTLRRVETELLEIAYSWSVVHDPARLDPAETGKPGREKSKQYGGAGTAPVTEFAAATLGARIGRTTHAAAALIADAQDLHHRLPQLWARVEAGEVRASYARHVCARTRDLTEAEAGYVDAEVVESADGRIPWTRFETLVDAKVVAAAPAVAREKEERARKARFAKRLRGEAHGMASFMIRADVATIELIDSTVTALAERLAEILPDQPVAGAEDEPALTVDDRRVHAVRLLMHPDADLRAPIEALLPTVTMYVHLDGRSEPDLTEDGDRHEVARLEGHGPVTTDWVRETLGKHAKVTIRPVIDPLGQAPVDAYEIPARHRRAVRLMTPADCFPYGSSTSPRQQIDHTVPFDAGGSSGVGNYGPLTTQHHRIKTFGHWLVKQPFPGIYVWRDPYGAHYLVDHTGTRPLPRTRDGYGLAA